MADMIGKACEEASDFNSIRKRKGTFKEETGSVSMDATELGTDAISLLPQEVLGHILSFLPTKLAASTSVLSQKWRTMFALVHNLHFDDSVLVHPEAGKHERPVIRECFRNFVDRTLALQCGSPINKFSLKYYNDEDSEMVAFVAPWIRNALQRGVVELYLTIKLRYVTMALPGLPARSLAHEATFLPSELFTSKTLVKLSLGKKFLLDKLPNVSLPALKSLFIDSIHFHCGDLCHVFLAGCPLLEDLVVRHKDFEAIPYCISSLTIKKLSVQYDCDYDLDFLSTMSFDAPSLVSLDYSDYALPEYTVNLESLVEAKLHLRYTNKVKNPDVSDLINGISNVQTLHLSPDSVDVISGCVKDLPMFNNLVSLSFGCKNKQGWKLLPYLLEQSPKLETLIIQGLDGYKGNWTMRLYQVKALHILCYGGTARELEHLKSFLGDSKCLELVQVEVAPGAAVDDGIIWQTKRNLSGVAALSKCKIEVTYLV